MERAEIFQLSYWKVPENRTKIIEWIYELKEKFFFRNDCLFLVGNNCISVIRVNRFKCSTTTTTASSECASNS